MRTRYWLPKTQEWYYACQTQDVPDGRMRQVHVYDQDVLVTNVDGEFYAMEPWCPHNFAPLELAALDTEDKVISCGEHHMEIDLVTGENLCGPHGMPGHTFEENWVFATKVENDRVYVRLKTDKEIEQYYEKAVPGVPFKADDHPQGIYRRDS